MIKTAATQALESSIRLNESRLEGLRDHERRLIEDLKELIHALDETTRKNQELKAALRRLEEDEE